MKSVAVFCGSRSGSDIYTDGARALGRALAEHNITLIYGGGKVGLMGAVADAVMEHGGRAVGIIPKFLSDKEIAHTGISELHIVDTMHERKKMMADLAEGFIMMPGGAGTLEEFFEIFTWAQLGLHNKPIGVLNINHFYAPLHHMLTAMSEQGFLDETYLTLADFIAQPEELISAMTVKQSPAVKRYDQ